MKNSRYFPPLLVLFAASGCSALIYEIVWYQLLQLAIGSTAVSLGVLLATFMGGLCLGSIGLPRLRLSGTNPLRVYAALEIGIGIFGILVLFAFPFIDRVYVAAVGYGLPGMLLRALMAVVCMLPATVLMGASLPAIVRWVERTPRGVSRWGLLYGGNTVGAVIGCLAAGFYLLRLYDVAVATYAAVAINFAVAAISYALAARAPAESVPEPAENLPNAPAEPSDSQWPIYTAIALSGMCALGAEVVWTRLMGMMLGATVYVFSIILAVFLIGLALGSAAGSWLLRRINARLALGWCQVLLALAIAWSAYAISQDLPYWPALLDTGPWKTLALNLARCLYAILPAALLWGASFPFAFAAVAPSGKESGRLVGGVYAANTLGAIAGALIVSLALVPWIGTQQTQRFLLLLSWIAAAMVLAPYARRYRSKPVALALTVSLVLSGILASRVQKIPGELIAYGRRVQTAMDRSNILYTAEGRNSSVAISIGQDGSLEVDVNGHVEATNEPFDMKLQRMVGHLPALLHPNPKSVLGIGFGAGVSAGTFTRYPGIQKITVCEIEPVIPPTTTKYFGEENYRVMLDPRTRIVYDDARHFVRTTTEKFDIIASDPLDVFVKGTAALYSKEYFEAVKQHLNPGGMFTLYVPLYETDLATIKSEVATFLEVFPHGTIWANTRLGEGYDMVFMGQVEPLKINLDEVHQRFARPDYAPVADSLRDIGVNSPIDLFATYAGQRSDLSPWYQGAQLNRDQDLRLQYLAGWGINSQLEAELYRDMMSHVRPPTTLFEGSPQLVASLMSAMAAESGGGAQP
ncbi:MAG TPA: fused MFS/spermidine synthase [Bryobacteraceae bacterium]|nr:fused MFS/spermidine synthase [Bryobacteraceae bacterium]